MDNLSIYVTKYNSNVLTLVKSNGKPLELQLFSNTKDTINNIYLCEIKDVVKNIDASFINYGDGKKGFLKSTKYHIGETVPLQMIKCGFGNKEPIFTDELTIAGEFVAVSTRNKKLSISRRIEEEKRADLLRDYSEIFSDLEYGIILRTNSVNAGFKELIMEADKLAATLDDILAYGKKRTIGTILFENPNEYTDYICNLKYQGISQIVTDDSEIYKDITSSVIHEIEFANPNLKVDLYEDEFVPFNSFISLRSCIKDATSKKVWLKSGGYIYIEQTEALVAVDVNSGKMTGGKNQEETFFKCNLEATDEIIRQLRLRNLSGIIIIDYINIKSADLRNKLLEYLKDKIKSDPVGIQFHDLTKLSLVELTRKKIREPFISKFGNEDNYG